MSVLSLTHEHKLEFSTCGCDVKEFFFVGGEKWINVQIRNIQPVLLFLMSICND